MKSHHFEKLLLSVKSRSSKCRGGLRRKENTLKSNNAFIQCTELIFLIVGLYIIHVLFIHNISIYTCSREKTTEGGGGDGGRISGCPLTS